MFEFVTEISQIPYGALVHLAEYIEESKEWGRDKEYINQTGLTVFQLKGGDKMLWAIVHSDDAIVSYTGDLDKEVLSALEEQGAEDFSGDWDDLDEPLISYGYHHAFRTCFLMDDVSILKEAYKNFLYST